MKMINLTLHNMERRELILKFKKYICKLKREFHVTTSSSIYKPFAIYLKGTHFNKF